MRVNIYIAIVALVALGFAILTISQNYIADFLGILLFSLIILLTEGLSIEIYTKDTSISTAAATLIAGTLLFGPMAALLLSIMIAATAAIKKHSNFSRLIFNTSNHLLSSSLVVVFVMVLRTSFTDLPAGLQLLVSMVSGVIVFFSSTVILTGVLHLSKKQPHLALWKEHFSWLMPSYIAFGVLSYTLILGYTYAGIFGLIAIIVPLLMLRIGQVQYIENTKMMVGQLHSKNDELETNNNVITRLNEDILLSLANLIDLRDSRTMGHSQNVSHIATRIAEEMQLPSETIEAISTAGLLHDIGKIGIPDSILFKPTQLSFEEFEIIKEHPLRGARILDMNHSLSKLSPIIRHHHERYDGRGYPHGLQGEAIPFEARILCLADSIQAMLSTRPYRESMELQEVIAEIKVHSGTQFDPQVVNIALEILLKDRGAFTLPHSEIIEEQREYELVRHLPLRNTK